MEENLRTQFDAILNLSSQLNSLSSQMNNSVAAVEHFLNVTCSLGVPAFVLVSERPLQNTYLEYRRVGNKFRIAVVESERDGPLEKSVKPWSDCTREVKIETFKKLPDLLAEIANELQGRVNEAEHAIESIKPIMASLTREPRSSSETSTSLPSDDIPFSSEDIPF